KVIISRPIVITIVKEKTSWINIPVCLQSETLLLQGFYFVSLFIHCLYLRKKILGTDSNIELGHLISSLFVNIRE
ncbi:hypothetical protein, partial [Streptococcus agalactiae]|uniref:hypothetical protein n=1 Tax=Streptococcus agalactiae TaxID=1311 RepID=UPI0012FE11BD